MPIDKYLCKINLTFGQGRQEASGNWSGTNPLHSQIRGGQRSNWDSAFSGIVKFQ
jgi:hypothetical protein